MTAAYGVEGFTDEHREALRRHGTERVLIAYDRDEAGERAAEKLGAELREIGIATRARRVSEEHGRERVRA